MRTQKLSRLLILGVAVTVLAGFATAARAQQQASGDVDQEIQQLFEKGVSNFEKGLYEEARRNFDEILSMRPGSKAALWMRKEAEIGLFARMKSQEELAPVADRFIGLMNEALREKRRKIENIEDTILDFQSDDLQTYGKALNRITGHGSYAIPHLLQLLTLEGEKNQRVVARTTMAISEMGRDAVLPLVAALNTDNTLLKARVAGLLEQVGDTRAVPALLSAAHTHDPDSAPGEAAERALKTITGKNSAGLPSPSQAYANLAEAYLHENHEKVGYLDLATGDLWEWNPDAEELTNKLVYRTYPSYIYFLRQGANVALDGLRVKPDDTRLQTLLLTLQTVQMSRCELFSSEERVSRLGGESLDEDTSQVASELLSQLEDNWPMLAHVSTPQVVGLALEETLAMGDSRSSLKLLKLLADKPALSAEQGGDSLLKALDSGDKELRYAAATAAVEQWPMGAPGAADKVVRVLSAALQQATAKTALLVFDNFSARNRVAHVLRQKGVTTVGCRPEPPMINSSLNLQPAVDAVFLTANIGEGRFSRVLSSLKEDVRVRGVPIYVVVDSRRDSVQVSKFEGIEGDIALGQVTSPDFESLVSSQLLQQSNTPLTEQKEETVLGAVQALLDVPPNATRYRLQELEPALTRALYGYREQVQDAALRALGRFGSAEALLPVSEKLARQDLSPELKARACHTLASILRRTDQETPEDVVARLRSALEDDSAEVRRAAAEAVGAAGLSAEELLELKAEFSRLQPVGQ